MMVILMLFGKIQKAYGLMALKIWILYFSLHQTQQTVPIKLGNGYQKSHTLKIYELNVLEAIHLERPLTELFRSAEPDTLISSLDFYFAIK